MPEPPLMTAARKATKRVRETLEGIRENGRPVFDGRVYLTVPAPGAPRPRAIYNVADMEGYQQSNGVTIVAEIKIELNLQADDAALIQDLIDRVQDAFDGQAQPPQLESIELDNYPVNDDDSLWDAKLVYKFRS